MDGGGSAGKAGERPLAASKVGKSMMMRKSVVLGVTLLSVLAAPHGLAADDDGARQGDCITISHIQRTEVIDDQTVLFYMTGGQIRKMTLAFRCPTLAFYKSFSYRTFTTRLCARVDEIVARSGSHCPIGNIQPISKADAAALKQAATGR